MLKTIWLIAAAIGPLPCNLYAHELPADAGGQQAASAGDAVASPLRRGEVAPGVQLIASYTGEAAANPVGGMKQKAAFTGELLGGVQADLGKLIGLGGGSVTFMVARRDGQNLSQIAIGNNTSVQEIFGVQTTRVVRMSYTQHFARDRVEVELGRISGNVAFFTSPFYCQFQSNSTCGSPTFTFKDSNFSYWPAASWAGRVKVWVTPKVYAHAGVWEVNPDNTSLTRGPFDFGTSHATGVTVPVELGYATNAANDRYPRSYRLGMLFDRSDYADPLYDPNGRVANVTGLPAATRHGRSFAYAAFDQKLVGQDKSEQGLTLFGNLMVATGGHVYESAFANLGLVQNGTFAGRPRDSAGIMVSAQRLSDAAVASIRAVKPIGAINRDQWIGEINYSLQLTSSVRLTPNMQFIHGADQTSQPRLERSIPDAFVLGLKFVLNAFP